MPMHIYKYIDLGGKRRSYGWSFGNDEEMGMGDGGRRGGRGRNGGGLRG